VLVSMTFLLVAVVVVGALCLADVLLTVTVLRRVRAQSAEIAALQASLKRYDTEVLVGREVFGVVAAHDLVGFLDASSPVSVAEVPRFTDKATGASALAVIEGDPPDIKALIALLSPVAKIVVGNQAPALAKIVGIPGFPTFLRIDDGRIGHAATAMADLAEPATTVKIPSQ